MNRITVLTSWTSGRQPQLAVDYFGSLVECSDVVGQINPIPNPNLYTVEAVCDDATLTLIEADANYYILSSDLVGV